MAAAWASTLASLAFAHLMGRPYLARVLAWQETREPDAEQSVVAWDAATNFPMRSFRANVLVRRGDRHRTGGRRHRR